MKLTLEAQKEIADEWFKFLQNQIYKEFEILEKKATKGNVKPKVFIKKNWKKNNDNEGGGTFFILKKGKIFDKVGVNQSTVTGVFPKKFKSNIILWVVVNLEILSWFLQQKPLKKKH